MRDFIFLEVLLKLAMFWSGVPITSKLASPLFSMVTVPYAPTLLFTTTPLLL